MLRRNTTACMVGEAKKSIPSIVLLKVLPHLTGVNVMHTSNLPVVKVVEVLSNG
jgi:hypothetical protein